MTNIVLTALIMVNGASVGHECFEVVPDTFRSVVKTCEACKNGWTPLEATCTCTYKEVKTGTYHLEPWPDFETQIRKACGLPPLVRTNCVPVCKGADCIFRRVVETNVTGCASRETRRSR